MLNDTDRAWLEEVEARCEKAVEGPWKRDNEYSIVVFQDVGDGLILATEINSILDADFIAAARTDIPRLIAMVRAGEVHAEWIMKIYDIDGEWHTARVCSNCEQNRVAGIGLAMYCPKCGAKMDGQCAGEE